MVDETAAEYVKRYKQELDAAKKQAVYEDVEARFYATKQAQAEEDNPNFTIEERLDTMQAEITELHNLLKLIGSAVLKEGQRDV